MRYHEDMNSLHATLYFKECKTVPMEVSHLYEHVVMQGFHDYLKEMAGIEPGVMGYFGGETYKNIIFLEAWFYDASIEALFFDFMRGDILPEKHIKLCIKQCEAESREKWHVSSPSLLVEQLRDLHASPWKNISDEAPFQYVEDTDKVPSPITIHKSASSFKSVIISPYFELQELSDNEKTLLLRLYVIIQDILIHHVRQNGWYTYDTHSLVEKGSYLFAPLSIGLPTKTRTNRSIEQEMTAALHAFDVKANYPYIKAHLDVFARQPTWQGMIRETLHHVDMIASNNAVAASVSEQAVMDLFQKVAVRVENISHSFATKLEY